jgi:hypothetical protein
MTYARTIRQALTHRLGADNVVFLKGWAEQHRGIYWQGPGGVPQALMVHHTAAAATDSTRSSDPGNRDSANIGIVKYINSHWNAPASNFVLMRSGRVYVCTVQPCWHSGVGTFNGKPPFDELEIPPNRFADYGMGVEVVSKGLKEDFTAAQRKNLGLLANAVRDSAGWYGFVKRLPNHRTWAGPRKVDTRYAIADLRYWAEIASRPSPN